jgi:hypothetical protein
MFSPVSLSGFDFCQTVARPVFDCGPAGRARKFQLGVRASGDLGLTPDTSSRLIRRAERIEGASPKEQDRIAGQLLLQTAVRDVESVEDDNGKPLAYTRDSAQQRHGAFHDQRLARLVLSEHSLAG